MLRPAVAASLHRTLLLDTHTARLSIPAVPPTRMAPDPAPLLLALPPISAPVTVMLVDPDAGTLVLIALLGVPASIDIIRVAVPTALALFMPLAAAAAMVLPPTALSRRLPLPTVATMDPNCATALPAPAPLPPLLL